MIGQMIVLVLALMGAAAVYGRTSFFALSGAPR